MHHEQSVAHLATLLVVELNHPDLGPRLGTGVHIVLFLDLTNATLTV